MDLAPTILAYFGIAPPDYMKGKALKELGLKAAEPDRPQSSSELALP